MHYLIFLFLVCLPIECFAKGSLWEASYTSPVFNNTRKIWIYTPQGYQQGDTFFPLLVVLDGQAYVSDLIPVPQLLDMMIEKREIPPIIVLFIDSIDSEVRRTELPCNQSFASMVVKEILPWFYKHYTATSDPKKTIITGSSYGGLAAVYMALEYPNIFGNVLSQSGAFGWKPEGLSGDWFLNYASQHQTKSLNFYLDVGDEETQSYGNQTAILPINRKLRDQLRNQGSQVSYLEYKGGHEYELWKQTFPIGLKTLLNTQR